MRYSSRPLPVLIAVLLCLGLLPLTSLAQDQAPAETDAGAAGQVLEQLQSREPQFPELTPGRDVVPGEVMISQERAPDKPLPERSELTSVPESAYPQQVIGTDERVRISPPFPQFVLLEALDWRGETLGSCSGTMIGRNALITAAHCLYVHEYGGFVDDLKIWFRSDGIYSDRVSIAYDVMSVPTRWADYEQTSFDWGLVVLPEPVGDETGWQTLTVASDATLSSPGLDPFVIGYPGDKPRNTQWIAATGGGVIDFDAEIIAHTLDTAAGMSGSAFMRGSDGGIIGIHSGAFGYYNEAVRIRQTVIDFLLDSCNKNGCSISYQIDPDVGAGTPDEVMLAFARTWARTDYPVWEGYVSRTWMWGPESLTGYVLEEYVEGPGGQRLVNYQEKSRMELTVDAGVPSSSPWFITNGLLSLELIAGVVQKGHNTFETRWPAVVNVAGDPDDPYGPTYATFTGLLDVPTVPSGTPIIQRVDRWGTVSVDYSLGGYGVYAAQRVTVPGIDHQIASPFWQFMNSYGLVFDDYYYEDYLFLSPYYATGYPVTEPYWATVKVGGVYRDVLMQCFERRCLTYTPGNPPGWEVEAGNVGMHYYIWRYGHLP